MNKKRIVAIVAIIALISVMAVVFAACNAETYQKRLEKAGYEVEIMSADDFDSAEIEWGLHAWNPKTDDIVIVLKFKSISKAKDAEAEYKKLDEYVERSSAVLFVGTEQGVADAK